MYASKRPSELSWYRPHLNISLRPISDACPDRSAPIIDAGGGESTLVDDLSGRGYSDVTVLDLSEIAIRVAKQRLGADARRVKWLRGDVTTYPFEAHQFAVWHVRYFTS